VTKRQQEITEKRSAKYEMSAADCNCCANGCHLFICSDPWSQMGLMAMTSIQNRRADAFGQRFSECFQIKYR